MLPNEDILTIEDDRSEAELCDDLRKLKRKLRGRDVQTIQVAIRELEALAAIRRDIAWLDDDLAEADRLLEFQELNDDPNARGKVELVAAALAVKSAYSFASVTSPRRSLKLLQNALVDLVSGGTVPAMFFPLRDVTNRPPAPDSIVAIKGALAGIMHVKQSAGMSREEAAKFVARNIVPRLAAQLSRKPLKARTVEEWLDRYGGKSGEKGVGRKTYLMWSRGEPVTAEKLREITERMANTLPAQKPS